MKTFVSPACICFAYKCPESMLVTEYSCRLMLSWSYRLLQRTGATVMAFSCSVRNTAGHLQVITAVRKMGSGWLRRAVQQTQAELWSFLYSQHLIEGALGCKCSLLCFTKLGSDHSHQSDLFLETFSKAALFFWFCMKCPRELFSASINFTSQLQDFRDSCCPSNSRVSLCSQSLILVCLVRVRKVSGKMINC